MEYCETCGAKLISYWHNINRPLCSALIRVYLKAKNNPFKITDLLSHNQICNFQKLKYWNLVEKAPAEGYWIITHLGRDFIKGEIVISRKVKTFRGKAIEFSAEAIKISDVIEGYQLKQDYLKNGE